MWGRKQLEIDNNAWYKYQEKGFEREMKSAEQKRGGERYKYVHIIYVHTYIEREREREGEKKLQCQKEEKRWREKW